MKVWEETWRWNEEDGQLHDVATGRLIVETDSGVYPPHGAERQLIEQAPAMARLLIEIRELEASATTDDFVYCMGEKMQRIEEVLRAAKVLP